MADDFNVDALLDGTLDDLVDLPEFKPYPPGGYRVLTNMVDKTAKKDRVNGHPGFELKMKLVEVLECSDDNPPAVGAETSVLYLLDNDIGQGQFKKVMASVATAFGSGNLRELVSHVNNAEAIVVTKVRQNKDKTQTYTDVVEIQFGG